MFDLPLISLISYEELHSDYLGPHTACSVESSRHIC